MSRWRPARPLAIIAAPTMRHAVIIALLSFAAPAAAQSAIVLTPTGDADSSVVERARAGVIEALAESGVRLVRTPDGTPCEDPECAATLAAESAVDWVLLVRSRLAPDGATQVQVVAVPAEGGPDEASVVVEDAGPSAAAASAVRTLLGRATDQRRGFLMVRTSPLGARVQIDGEPAGASPLRRMVSPGEHTVRVVPVGGAPIERTVTVTPLTETEVAIDVEDADGDAPPTVTTATRSEPSPFNWIIGGALAIGGVVALVSPLQTIAQHGECVEEIADAGCVERVEFGAQSGVLLGVGVALLVAAIAVDAVAPIRVDVAVTESAGVVYVGGRF